MTRIAALAPLASLAAALAACGGAETDPADLLITAAVVRTGLESAAPAEAVAIDDGKIVYVGDRAGAKAFVGAETETVDLGDGALYPGFVDAHVHLIGIGLRELTLNLDGARSVADLVAAVEEALVGREAGVALYGRGWIETGWPEGRMPTAADLDPIAPETPVILERADGHAVVVNSAALAAAGIDAGTPDPAGGEIVRDATGAPTGLLIDNAARLVMGLIEQPSAEIRRRAFEVGGDVYAARGWTGVHNMSVSHADVPIMEELAEVGELPLRVYNALDIAHLDALIEETQDGPRVGGDGRIVTGAVKVYFDGALGSRGAALFEPYTDRPETRGLVLMEDDAADAAFAKARAAGLQVAAHAIGDRGNRLALDAMDRAFADGKPGDLRWRIEHAQIVAPEDIPRFAELGVIASMQPSHAIGDLFFAPARLGPTRLRGAYAWRSMLDAGVQVAGGSDAPVEVGSPLIEFYAASVRKSLDGFSDENWRREERITPAETLAIFTTGPAYAAFAEERRGLIRVGFEADLTAFDTDLLTAPGADILKAKALLTVVDGRVAYVEGSLQ